MFKNTIISKRSIGAVYKFSTALLFCIGAYCTTYAQKFKVAQALQTINIAKTNNELAKAELSLSNAYLLVNVDSSIYYANKVLNVAIANKNTALKADALLVLGESYSYINQQIRAIEYLLDAKDLYETIGNSTGEGHCFFALGELYGVIKQAELSRNYYFRAILQFKQQNKEEEIGNAYASLGDRYCADKKFDSAFFYSNLALAIGKKYKSESLVEYVYANLGEISIERGDFENARSYLFLARQLSYKLGNDYGIAYGKLQLGKLAFRLKNFTETLKYTDTCISIARQLKMDDLIMDATDLRYKTFKATNNEKMALLSLEQHKSISDTLLSFKKYFTLNGLLEQYRNEKRQKELDLLKEQNNRNTIILFALSGITILIILLVISFYKRFKERKKMLLKLSFQHDSIQNQAKDLRQINSVKDRMFSIISHDLRGPVSSLKGLIDFMKTESLSAEDSEMIVKELKQSVSGVDMLLENLLVWAQLQIRGDVSVKKELVDIESIAKEIIFISTNAASQKNIQLKMLIEKGITVEADRNHIALIIRNLVNNSIKFTPNGGTVTIEAKHHTGKVKLCVEDTGVGMTEEEMNKLFKIDKPFSQLGTENEKGSGLGLLFVKEYIQICGGEFTITSTKGKGSRFCVTL